MTDLSSLPFHGGEAPATRNGAVGRKPCRRHDHVVWVPETDEWECQRCGHRTPVERIRRGRSSSRLGKDQERRIERVYGPRKVGEYGDACDHLGRDWKWQAKATRSAPPKWLAEIGMPTYREQVPEFIWRAAGHMAGIGGTRFPLVIRSYVRNGVATRDWIFVQSHDWLQLHGFGMPAGWIILPGSDFLELNGRDGP